MEPRVTKRSAPADAAPNVVRLADYRGPEDARVPERPRATMTSGCLSAEERGAKVEALS